MIAQTLGRWDPTRPWRSASNIDKVRAYTRQSFLGLCLLIGVVGAFTAAAAGDTWPAVCVAVCAVACVVAVTRIPALGGAAGAPVHLPVAVSAAAAGCFVAVAWARGAEPGMYLWITMLVSVPLAALVSWRLVAAGTAVFVVAVSWAGYPAVGTTVGVVIGCMTATVHISVWLLRIVTELDEARGAAAALSVAEERLRFSRDLHDVVGRALSAIAVKSDLAATLARRGDDRAADQMDEVRELAQVSLTEARELVRGYRSITLASELAGAGSLLQAAGIGTTVSGSADDLPAEVAEAAAWVVREAATNILRHSAAEHCTVEITATSITIGNDGVLAPRSGGGTGLRGVRERVAGVGGLVEITEDAGTFTVAVRFPDREESTR